MAGPIVAWLETVPSQLLASKKSTQRARLAGSRMLWGSMAGFLRDHEGFDVFNFADDMRVLVRHINHTGRSRGYACWQVKGGAGHGPIG